MSRNRQQSGGRSSGGGSGGGSSSNRSGGGSNQGGNRSGGGGGRSNQGGNRSGGGGGRSNRPPRFRFSAAEGVTPAEFDYQSASNLLNAQGNIDTQIANINSDAARYVTELETGAQKDVASTQAGATRYVADRELESNLGVENIRAKGAVDLQKVVNTGMERVEGIRGEYGIKGKKVDRSTAILGGLVSAFNF